MLHTEKRDGKGSGDEASTNGSMHEVAAEGLSLCSLSLQEEGPGDAREASNSYLIETAEVYYQVHGIATPSVHVIPWAT